MKENIFYNLVINNILNVIDKEFKKPKSYYKIKYSNEYYLKHIMFMLNDINKWSSLRLLKTYDSNMMYHYKTIYNKFRLWTQHDIFNKAFLQIIPTHKEIKIKDLFIDNTFIYNKYGSEDLSRCTDNMKKRTTKVVALVDKNKYIYSLSSIKIPFNKKAVHDTKTIQTAIDNINKNIKLNRIRLIGDKGFITKNKFKFNNNTVKLITPKRKNQKTKNTKFEMNKLKQRHKIENLFCFLKKDERVILRKDRSIKTFMSFLYISAMKHNIKLNL